MKICINIRQGEAGMHEEPYHRLRHMTKESEVQNPGRKRKSCRKARKINYLEDSESEDDTEKPLNKKGKSYAKDQKTRNKTNCLEGNNAFKSLER